MKNYGTALRNLQSRSFIGGFAIRHPVLSIRINKFGSWDSDIP